MNAIKNIAACARTTGVTVTFCLGAAWLVAGCGALPDKPARAVLYDFGPGISVLADATGGAAAAKAVSAGASSASAAPTPALPAITLADVDSNARLDGTQLLYRLGYADANQLRPYGHSRWSMAPAQLLSQRLRDALAAHHTVLGPEESASIARTEGKVPDTLRITLDEFSHYFKSPTDSVGLVRLRATLIQNTAGGDRVLGQRSVTVERPAATPDAPGGVQALAAASDAAVAQVIAWVDRVK